MSSWRTGEHRSLSPAPSVEKARADAPGDPGHKAGRGSIANILAQRCIDPAPLRGKRTT